jgi:hypothetical protein
MEAFSFRKFTYIFFFILERKQVHYNFIVLFELSKDMNVSVLGKHHLCIVFLDLTVALEMSVVGK